MRGAGTDWSKLRRMSAARIRKGIAADPDAHATGAAFWKSAEVVMPTRKEIVTMRALDAEPAPLVPPTARLPDPHQCHLARVYAGTELGLGRASAAARMSQPRAILICEKPGVLSGIAPTLANNARMGPATQPATKD